MALSQAGFCYNHVKAALFPWSRNERRSEENRQCHKERNEESCEQARQEDRRSAKEVEGKTQPK